MDQAVLQVAVEDLRQKLIELNDKQKKTEDAIKALQEICEHEFAHKHECEDFMRNPINKNCIYCDLEQKV